MSDPTRLVESAGESEKGLLRAWQARQPSAAARMGTLAAVGAGGAVGLVSGGAAVLPKVGALSSSLVKWVAVACGVAATAGVATYAVQQRDVAPVPVVGAPREATHAPPAPPPPVPAPPAVAITAAPALPSPPTTAGAAAAKTAPPASSLDEEVRAVGQARRALRGRDADSALGLLDAYDARFPSGALAEESAELRVEALYESGRRREADALAARFLSAHPASPYARVVRALAGGGAVPSP